MLVDKTFIVNVESWTTFKTPAENMTLLVSTNLTQWTDSVARASLQ